MKHLFSQKLLRKGNCLFCCGGEKGKCFYVKVSFPQRAAPVWRWSAARTHQPPAEAPFPYLTLEQCFPKLLLGIQEQERKEQKRLHNQRPQAHCNGINIQAMESLLKIYFNQLIWIFITVGLKSIRSKLRRPFWRLSFAKYFYLDYNSVPWYTVLWTLIIFNYSL